MLGVVPRLRFALQVLCLTLLPDLAWPHVCGLCMCPRKLVMFDKYHEKTPPRESKKKKRKLRSINELKSTNMFLMRCFLWPSFLLALFEMTFEFLPTMMNPSVSGPLAVLLDLEALALLVLGFRVCWLSFLSWRVMSFPHDRNINCESPGWGAVIWPPRVVESPIKKSYHCSSPFMVYDNNETTPISTQTMAWSSLFHGCVCVHE